MDSLMELGISVVPDKHDAKAFTASRIRMSDVYTDCDIPREQWKGNTFTNDFNRIVRSRAVTTATLTVSMTLSTVYGTKSRYTHRKALTIVVHAIK